MNSKGELTVDQIIIGLIVMVTVGIVVGFMINLDILENLKIILPDFGSDSSGEVDDVYSEVYLNQDGRCKPIEGVYSLTNGRLEAWDRTKWVDIEDQLPSEASFRNKEISENLINSVSEKKLNYQGKEYDVIFTSLGFEVTLNNRIYLFVPLDSLYERKGSRDTVQLLPGGEPSPFVDYTEILDSFSFTFGEFPYFAEIYYNRGTEFRTTQPSEERIEKMFVYLADSQTGNIYGIDSSHKFYEFSHSIKDYLAIEDWKEISETNIISTLEVNLMKTKKALDEEC